jgi:hypothetical protein
MDEKYGTYWAILNTMRPIDYVKKTYLDYSNCVYVLQNDGDEIHGRNAMAHFKACELVHTIKKGILSRFQTQNITCRRHMI